MQNILFLKTGVETVTYLLTSLSANSQFNADYGEVNNTGILIVILILNQKQLHEQENSGEIQMPYYVFKALLGKEAKCTSLIFVLGKQAQATGVMDVSSIVLGAV